MRLGGIYISVGAKTDKLKRDLAKAEGLTKKTAVLMRQEIGRISFAQVGIATAAFTFGIAALGKKVVTLGREFESTMKTVQAWSGATGRDLKKLTDIARTMGATTEHTAVEAAGALKYLAAAGFTAKQSIAALPETLDLATAGQVDLATSTDIVTDVLTAFGLKVEELSRVNDAFITTSSSVNTHVLLLGQSFKMVAPTAKLFGYTVEQTAALLGTLAGSMVKGEMAGSGLNMVLLRSSKAAKMLGLDAMTPLVTVLEKIKEAQWNATKIGLAFGNRQVKTAVILMDNIDKYKKLHQEILNNTGATSRLADIIRDSLDVDLKTLNSTIQEELLRTFDKYKDDMREVVQATTAWIRQNPQAIDQISEFAENMAKLAIAMGKVIGYGVEFTNVWVNTWAAMGLASAGIITWKDALLDGVNAVNLFETEVGRLQLRAKLLKDEIAEIQKFKDMMRFYYPGEKDRLKAIQQELINIEANIKLIQLTASKGLGLEKAAETAEDAAAKAGKIQKISAKQATQIEKEWLSIKSSIGKSATAIELANLQDQYEAYKKVAQDKVALEKWWATKKAQIELESTNKSIALYKTLFEITGYEEYANKAIEAYGKILDKDEAHWHEILGNADDALIIRMQKENEFVQSIYGSLGEIVGAESAAANERIKIATGLANTRVAIESSASRAIARAAGFELSWGPPGRSPGGTVGGFGPEWEPVSGGVTINVPPYQSGTGSQGLPYTGLFQGHKGEIIKSPAESDAERSGGAGNTYNITIAPQMMTGDRTAARAVAVEIKEALQELDHRWN